MTSASLSISSMIGSANAPRIAADDSAVLPGEPPTSTTPSSAMLPTSAVTLPGPESCDLLGQLPGELDRPPSTFDSGALADRASAFGSLSGIGTTCYSEAASTSIMHEMPPRWVRQSTRMTKGSQTSWLGVIFLGVSLNLAAMPRIAPTMPAQPQSQAPQSDRSDQADRDATKPQSLDLTEEVVRDVLSRLQHAIEGRNLNQVLAVFDPQKPHYADLHDQFMAFFQRYGVIQFRYQVLQVTSEKD